jgi:hypothetical protein
MQGVIVGFRYATSRWLALVGLSLVFFLLILKDLPLLRTLVVRIYRRKKWQQHTMSTHAYMVHPNHATHNSNIEYQKQTCSDTWTNNIFYKGNITQIIAKQFLLTNRPYSQANKLQASICIKTRQPAYIQVANNITEPLQLESIQKNLLVNYNELAGWPAHLRG